MHLPKVCGIRISHRRNVPCQDEVCPECGAKMLRVVSEHYRLWLKKKGKTELEI